MQMIKEIEHQSFYVMDMKVLYIDQNIADLVNAKQVF